LGYQMKFFRRISSRPIGAIGLRKTVGAGQKKC
jgi:hypothetical protein